MAARQKKFRYSKIIKNWAICIEISLFIVPISLKRKYNNLRKTFRDYNSDTLLDRDDGIVQTATEQSGLGN